MMRKQFFMVALAALALASCSKDEVTLVNQGEGINFRASMNKTSTRGTETTVSNLGTFYVSAIGNDALYFSGLSVTSEDGTTWTPASTYYWPDYTLNFFAFAPAASTSGYTLTPSITADAQTLAFTQDETASAQKDLVVAYQTATQTTGSVALNFEHALSQIEVHASNANSNAYKVEVVGVKVVNVAGSATFTNPKTVTTTERYYLSLIHI